jgi:hypothetical protein
MNQFAAQYGVEAIPATFIMMLPVKLYERFRGAELRAKILELLAK